MVLKNNNNNYDKEERRKKKRNRILKVNKFQALTTFKYGPTDKMGDFVQSSCPHISAGRDFYKMEEGKYNKEIRQKRLKSSLFAD